MLAGVVFPFPAPSSAGDQPAPPAIVETWNRKAEEFRGIRVYLELEIAEPPSRSPRRAFGQLAYERASDRVYLKTFTALAPHVFTLIARGNSFQLQVPKMRTVFQGPLEAMGREDFQIKITPQDVKRMLRLDPVEDPAKSRVEDRGSYWAVLVSADRPQGAVKERELWLSKGDGAPMREIRYGLGGEPYLEIEWGDPSGTPPFPAQITLTRKATGLRIRFFLKKWELTGSVPDDWFELTDTEGYKIEEVEP